MKKSIAKTISIHNIYLIWYRYDYPRLKKGKVFYGQKPPSRESTTTECGYQLVAVIN